MLQERATPSHASSQAQPNHSEPKERRRRPRRSEDIRQQKLSELTLWFANREQRALIVVDSARTILLINDAGHTFLKGTREVGIEGAKLRFQNAREQAAFVRGVAENSASPCPLAGLTHSANCTRISQPSQAGSSFAVVFDSIRRSATTHQIVRSKLGLTYAEAEVAIEIFNGLSLVRIAKDRNASVNTVKTQTRYIFQKCRVHSQVALTKQLAELMRAP